MRDTWPKPPDERPIYLSALARTPNPNPLPPLSGKPVDESFLSLTKGKIGSDECVQLSVGVAMARDTDFVLHRYDAKVKARHPEVFQKQPLKVHMTVCDQCLDLAPVVITNLVTFFATGTPCLKSSQVERLIRMIPPGIPGFRVELLTTVFYRIVDLRKIDRVLWALSFPERMEAVRRLGWLNLSVAMAMRALVLFLTFRVRVRARPVNQVGSNEPRWLRRAPLARG